MQEIAKYILSQLPKLNDFELDQISSLATTLRLSRRIRTPHIDNPILTYGVGYAKGFPIVDELEGSLGRDAVAGIQGDWAVNTDTDKPM